MQGKLSVARHFFNVFPFPFALPQRGASACLPRVSMYATALDSMVELGWFTFLDLVVVVVLFCVCFFGFRFSV